ncbi:amidohydrolase [Selenomonas sp. AB3002]|uniref:amidohydrolase n=1 Tax=Selenomonas sp. AB3002 TaxID=1392502 RepID=UPI0004981B44
MKTLIKNVNALLPDGTTPVTNIMIEGDRIEAVGEVPEGYQADKVIDGKDHLAAPGLVNAHTHASMTLLRCYADDMVLMDWLNNKIWPTEARMNDDDIYWGAMLAAAEMIRTGTTAFADMYGPYMDKVAEVTIDSGLRGVLSRGLIGVAPDSEEKLAENIALYKDFHGAGDGRVTVMFAPHALYTCPPDYLKKVSQAAGECKAEIHIHMSETQGEVENCLKEYGKRPFAHVEATGIFEHGTLAAHCVHLDDEDIAIIKKHDIRVAHNPGSNMKLASGVAPVPRLLKEGVCVALGTDGASSNNNLDMLEEVQLAALLHKADTLDPLAVTAAEAVKMGTEYGAQAVGLKDAGKLAAGALADIVLYDMKNTMWCPRHNLVSLLVYSARSSSVDTVLVAGRVLMENHELKTLDEERILFEAQRCADRLTK